MVAARASVSFVIWVLSNGLQIQCKFSSSGLQTLFGLNSLQVQCKFSLSGLHIHSQKIIVL